MTATRKAIVSCVLTGLLVWSVPCHGTTNTNATQAAELDEFASVIVEGVDRSNISFARDANDIIVTLDIQRPWTGDHREVKTDTRTRWIDGVYLLEYRIDAGSPTRGVRVTHKVVWRVRTKPLTPLRFRVQKLPESVTTLPIAGAVEDLDYERNARSHILEEMEDEYEKSLLVRAFRERDYMLANGIRIPKTFAAMMKTYKGTYFDPPLSFAIHGAPKRPDYSNITNAVVSAVCAYTHANRKQVEKAWGSMKRLVPKDRIAPLVPRPLSNIKQCHVLATVPITTSTDVRYVIAYCRLVDPTAPLDSGVKDLAVAFKWLGVRWELTRELQYFPGVMRGCYAQGLDASHRHGDLDRNRGWVRSGVRLIAILRDAGYPSEMTRICPEAECQRLTEKRRP